MDELIRNANSKRASNVTPHVIKVMQEHSERLLKLEALVAINTKLEPTKLEPENVEEPIKVINTREPLIRFDDIEVEIPEPELENADEDEMIEVINPMILELQTKICRMNADADVLALELDTLRDIEDDADDVASEIDDDCSSVCTVECREMIKDIKPEMQRIGSWNNTLDQQCDGCTKVQIKAYKKQKKQAEKERAKAQKVIKQKQKELLKEEQKELQVKLQNLKKGRSENHGLDNNRQTQMKAELKKLANEYQNVDKTNPFITQ